MTSFTLANGTELHELSPETFWIPPLDRRENLRQGEIVKLMFRIEVEDEVHVERMWVQVTRVQPEFYVGILDNDPYCTDELSCGMRVEFHSDHVIQIWEDAA